MISRGGVNLGGPKILGGGAMNPNDAMTSATCKKNFFKANKQGASKFLILKGKASSKVVRVSPPLTQKSAFLFPHYFAQKMLNLEFSLSF